MRARLRGLLAGEFPALPLDLFRLAAGLLCLAYFTSELASFRDFTSPEGLLDHAFLARVYWFSRISLFQPGAAEWWLKGCLAAAWLACWGVILGWRVRACAGLAFAVAVSVFRRNLIVMEIDDAIVNLLLLWLLLLPTGKTLVLRQLLREGPAVWERWRRQTVPAAAVRLLQANALLIYLVAGLSKLRSPFWRQGFALYATLRLPMSRTADFWGPQHLALLSAATRLALAVELSLPLLLALPRGSRLKRLGLLCQLGFHGGILAAFGLPYVNLAMAATSLLFFAEDPALVPAGPAPLPRPSPLRGTDRVAITLVCALALSVAYDWPVIGALSAPAGAVLWVLGINQDYHLFNWIDTKNYRVANDLLPEASAREDLFPASTRGYLAQAYLHNVAWSWVPCERRPALKRGILERSARRACARGLSSGRHEAHADVVRITPGDPGLERPARKFLMEFECRDGKAELLRTFDLRAQAPDCR